MSKMVPKVRSFNLKRGTRIGNYRILEKIGRGCEGEVYKVTEVPTGVIRALKLFRSVELESVRQLLHCAWYYDQLYHTGHFPNYYQYGQWFLDGSVGCWFLILEFIEGIPFGKKIERRTNVEREKLFFRLAHAVADVHEYGYAIGDFSHFGNVILGRGGHIFFIDCDPGTPGHPNRNYRNDCETELPMAAECIFKRRAIPPKVKAILKDIASTKRFHHWTLRIILTIGDK